MNKTPILWIYMVCYNAQTYSMRAVESLLSRTVTPHVLHVLDNGSTDATWSWLQPLGRQLPEQIHAYRVPENLGAQGGKQWLLDQAPPPADALIAIVDNDIEVFPGWDEPIVAWFAAHPEAGIVGAQGYRLQHVGDHRAIRPVYPGPDPAPADVITGFLTLLSATVWQASGYRYTGSLNGYWHHDDDLCLHVAAQGYTQYVWPHPAVIHYGSQSSQTVPGLLTPSAAHTNQQALLAQWREKQWIDGSGSPVRFRPVPEYPIVTWEGALLQPHSLAQVNRQSLKALIAAEPEVQWAWRPIDGREQEPWNYDDGWTLWSHRESLAVSSAVEVRHRYPPRWDRPSGETGLVLIQPWEYQTVPPGMVQGLNQADQVWVPSTYVADVYRTAHVDASKIRVIPNGVDLTRFTPEGRRLSVGDPDRVTFLYVGGLLPRKGYDVLWKAYLTAFVVSDPVQLVIRDVGTGTVYAVEAVRQQLLQRSADPSLPRVIMLTCDLSERDLAALYRTADVVVQPYRAEGFCLPLLEAMASGTPIIAPEGGGSGDFVVPEAGWLLPTHPMTQWTLGQLGYAAPQDTTPAPHAEPDFDALVSALRSAAESVRSRQSASRGMAGRLAAESWSWHSAARGMRDALSPWLGAVENPGEVAL
ncbi:MAG: glycosyltransferase [Thermaerobacter sp.]|nr:glycosyltransferase [Thermaerobacter sp.]